MATTMKLSLTFVLLFSVSGLVVFGDAGATCDTIRCIQGGNITCDNRRDVIQGCHCVCAPKNGKGCVLLLHDGSTYNCPTTKC